MAKKTAEKKNSARFAMPNWRLWPLMVIGLGLLVLAGVMYQQIKTEGASDRLLGKLPADSYAAGIVQLSSLNTDTVKQLSTSVNAGAPQTTSIIDTVTKTGATQLQLAAAVQDRFAFASTTHGSVAIFTIRDASRLPDLAKQLNASLVEPGRSSQDGTEYYTGKIAESGATIAAAANGRELYVASNVDLIKQALTTTDGITSVNRFREVAGALPSGRDGYLFYQPAAVRTKIPIDLPLTGIAWSDDKDQLRITIQTAGVPPISVRPSRTDGKLLPSTGQATASIEGRDLTTFIHLLEEQRAEADVPKVLTFRNGLNSLNRSLGVDFEEEFLAPADGRFVYAQYPTPTGNEWMGLLEYPNSETALAKTQGLINLARAKLTVPVRKQIVRVLPDGTQSREIISEGREPLGIADYTVGARTGQFTTLPGSVGNIYSLVDGKNVILASSADGINRMLTTLAAPAPSDQSGDLVVRATIRDLKVLLKDPDSISDWVFALRPLSGRGVLNKQTGEFNGSFEFAT